MRGDPGCVDCGSDLVPRDNEGCLHRNLPHAGTSQLMRQFGPCVALYGLPWALTGPRAFLLVRTLRAHLAQHAGVQRHCSGLSEGSYALRRKAYSLCLISDPGWLASGRIVFRGRFIRSSLCQTLNCVSDRASSPKRPCLRGRSPRQGPAFAREGDVQLTSPLSCSGTQHSAWAASAGLSR